MGVTAIRAWRFAAIARRSAVGNDAMSQAAKAQEPSMEEILASIRRIIADDDAAKPAEPAGKPPAAAALPPCRRRAAAAAGRNRTRPTPCWQTAAASRRRGRRRARFDRSHDGAAAAEPAPAPTFRTIEAGPDVVFTDRAPEPPEAPPRAKSRPRAWKSRAASRKPRSPTARWSRRHRRRGRQRLQFAGADRARQQRAHARGPGEGNAAADAQVLARRQSAGPGRAHRARRDRARLARSH